MTTVFLSWSGEYGKSVAQASQVWLPPVPQGASRLCLKELKLGHDGKLGPVPDDRGYRHQMAETTGNPGGADPPGGRGRRSIKRDGMPSGYLTGLRRQRDLLERRGRLSPNKLRRPRDDQSEPAVTRQAPSPSELATGTSDPGDRDQRPESEQVVLPPSQAVPHPGAKPYRPTGMATASLVFAILGLTSASEYHGSGFYYDPVGTLLIVVCPILALVFGHIAFYRIRRGQAALVPRW
jgi:hypothetical protein